MDIIVIGSNHDLITQAAVQLLRTQLPEATLALVECLPAGSRGVEFVRRWDHDPMEQMLRDAASTWTLQRYNSTCCCHCSGPNASMAQNRRDHPGYWNDLGTNSRKKW